jgi:hypothetical protein
VWLCSEERRGERSRKTDRDRESLKRTNEGLGRAMRKSKKRQASGAGDGAPITVDEPCQAMVLNLCVVYPYLSHSAAYICSTVMQLTEHKFHKKKVHWNSESAQPKSMSAHRVFPPSLHALLSLPVGPMLGCTVVCQRQGNYPRTRGWYSRVET